MLSLFQGNYKEHALSFNEPLTCACLEARSNIGTTSQNVAQLNSVYSNANLKDRSFLVGTLSGRIIHYKPSSWFTQKEVVLFAGAGSAVTNIQKEGNLIAWSDASQVLASSIELLSNICVGSVFVVIYSFLNVFVW